MQQPDQIPAPPWWKFGHVWLVVAGPVIVVIAAFVTLYLALRHPDPVLTGEYYSRGIALNQSLANPAASLAPAVDARNHAATGVVLPASDRSKP